MERFVTNAQHLNVLADAAETHVSTDLAKGIGPPKLDRDGNLTFDGEGNLIREPVPLPATTSTPRRQSDEWGDYKEN
ncbi:unnamed protein product [Bursaphelenchus xylophilus]|uniref:(pine wood nematode) hypothetical protein n=1 Tax=Bursaphelenchus xylophilus TaxID=6326 RepID=A0A1I7RIF6_BURXY|nr:unnamed protein product [Bursaphelenchus xylophilus]CAG9080813.1 unnamed protein product [Bursaphelenchus xylophilus]